MITKENEHVAKAIDLLFEQFKKPINGNESSSVNLQKFLSCFVNQIQDIEDTCDNLMNSIKFSQCVSDALDRYGQIAGEPRNSRSDSAYRLGIQSRLVLNRSCGTFSDFVNMLINAGLTTGIKIIELPDATIDFTLSTNILNNPVLVQQIKNVVAVGVHINIYNNSFSSGIPFVLSDINSSETPIGGMLYDLVDPDENVSGKLVDIL